MEKVNVSVVDHAHSDLAELVLSAVIALCALACDEEPAFDFNSLCLRHKGACALGAMEMGGLSEGVPQRDPQHAVARGEAIHPTVCTQQSHFGHLWLRTEADLPDARSGSPLAMLA